MKPTLYVLAAGMGSRYGGLKQLDGVGPSGETIMDYSIYDAVKAGFGKVVFVIRKSFEADFTAKIATKYTAIIPVEIVFQELDSLPEGFKLPADRERPWGTNHAVMMAKEVIHEPFAVINADDFYGRDSFRVLADYLRQMEGTSDNYCMVGYRLANTLSESGSVSRGVCQTNDDAFLTTVIERSNIVREGEMVVYKDAHGTAIELPENAPVSMNMWGFTPDYFTHSDELFTTFLEENLHNSRAEFFIPTVVNQLIESKTSRVYVLDTSSKWFGVTYAEDRPQVVAKLQALVAEGVYPSPLF